MGISASCQPNYPRHNDFVQLIRNANNFIMADRQIWSSNERTLLQTFFENLQLGLQNTQDYNLQLPWGSAGVCWESNPQVKDYFTRVRLVIPKTAKIGKIFSLLHPGEDFSKILPKSQNQLAHIYALIAFLWLMYHDGCNAAKYFYQSDILNYIYFMDHQSIETMMNAIEKIYFTGKDSLVPARCLIIPTCSFRLIEGQINSFGGEIIEGPKTYKVIPNPDLINEPFYTLSPVRIEIFLTTPPYFLEKEPEPLKCGLDRIHEDINDLVAALSQKKVDKLPDWDEDFNSIFDEQSDPWQKSDENELFNDRFYIRRHKTRERENSKQKACLRNNPTRP